MRRTLGRVALLIVALCCTQVMGVWAQSQMLLPYNDILFQSTWENPAVRPMHRFSVGLPILSSVEAGVINNGFKLSDVSEKDGEWLNVDLAKVIDALRDGRAYQQYAETQIDLLHFRMKWRDYFFWLGARNVTTQTFGYGRDLFDLVYRGNGAFVGKELTLNKATMDVKNYHEITFGLSKEIGKQWMVGFRASFLSGLASGLASFDELNIAINGDPARMYAHSIKGSGAVTTSSLHRFSKDELKKPGTWFNVKNLGFALAGGVSYRPIPGLTLSLAFSDIGLIDWNDGVREYQLENKKIEVDALIRGKQMFKKFGFQNVGRELRRQVGDFNTEMTDGARYTQWLAPKFHLLGTYEFARQSVVGASFSGIYQAKTFYPSATVSIMQGVSDIFQIQASWSYNQYSALNFGAGLVVCPGPVQLYVVTDNFLAFINPKLAKATNVRLGVNLVFERLNRNHMLTYDR